MGSNAISGTGSSTIVAQFENANGSCFINPTNSSISCSSDQRLKKNITPLGSADGLALVSQLNPIFFNWNNEASGTPEHGGFIAQQVMQIAPDLVIQGPDGYYALNYAGFAPYTVKAIQELNLDLSTIASTTASSTPESQSFAASFFSSLFSRLIQWLGDATNGIGNLFAHEIHTNTLCVAKSDGTEVCITGDQLAALLAGQSTASSSPTLAATSSAPTAPAISINGNNPATVAVGSTYTDLGAVLTGPAQDLNLGLHAVVDGGATTTLDQVTIDTSAPGIHTVEYFATDQNGLTGYATRTVDVVGALSASATSTSVISTQSSAVSSTTTDTVSTSTAVMPTTTTVGTTTATSTAP